MGPAVRSESWRALPGMRHMKAKTGAFTVLPEGTLPGAPSTSNLLVRLPTMTYVVFLGGLRGMGAPN